MSERTDPLQRCIHELFAAQAVRSPGAAAVIFENGQLSYGELDAQANQLAHYLQSLGVGPEALVGLCLERSPQLLVGLLGILKAGAGFVPLDPDFPPQRLEYMLRDTASPVIVTQARFNERFAGFAIQSVCMDSDWGRIVTLPTHTPQTAVDPQNLAYCIYTSGSTGQPKAVAMPHRGLVNHILHVKDALRHSASDRVLQFTAITADGSLQEIFTSWLSGAALVLPTQKAPSIRDFLQMLIRQRVSVVSVPTAYWHFWVGEMQVSPAEWPETVRLVILGGEKVIAEKFRQWRQLECTRDVAWVQDYGPTETTVSCTAFEAPPHELGENLCIGRPNANMQIYMLDAQGDVVPAGEIGELCIAGFGLARGYLHRPALTAEKFLPNPFGEPGTRLYRTGDLARYLPDGTIEFLGRRDDQVKIMGHRIELGEIESALLRCAGVRQAVVLARESIPGSKQLVAYVVADAFDEHKVREHLRATLPLTSMPAQFIAMAQLPSTVGGKVDRARLLATAATTITPILDATDLERAIALLWAENTGRAACSLDEDFFLAGGDSLRALSLLNAIAARIGVDLDAGSFFQERTIRALAASLRSHAIRARLAAEDTVEKHLVSRLAAGLPACVKLRRSPSTRLPASNAQQRLWFLDQMQQGAAVYSVPLAYRIVGAFSVERLDRCLSAAVARHEALRTALVMTPDNRLWQDIAAAMAIRSRTLQASSLVEAMQLVQAEAGQAFDLARPPLLRSLCIRIAEQEWLWLLVLHHSVCDAWSIAGLWRELVASYNDAEELPPPQFQYGDYSNWQAEWLAGAEAAAHRKFWREHLAGELPVLQLGRRVVPEDARSTCGAMEQCQIDSALSRAVRAAAEQHRTTEFVILLSAFLATLHRYTRQDGILVGVPAACRSFAQTEHIVGYFANTLPLRTVFAPQMRFSELIHQTAQTLADVLAHQDLPFDQIVDATAAAREGSSNPLFQAMFVMQTTPLDGSQRLGAAQVEEVIVHSGTSKVDVTCSMRATAGRLEGELEYSTDVLSPPEARCLVRSFLSLLSAATANSATRIEALCMLSGAQRDELIRRANSRFETYPDFRPLHVHFESQVLATPDAIAIESGGVALRYAELNAQANRLARRLLHTGVGPESLIGICMDRCVGMVTAVLAILKAGAGFVPLDPDYPLERLRAIVDDAGLMCVITQELYAARLPSAQVPVLIEPGLIDATEQGGEDAANPAVVVCAENVAYIYYTSGSTGIPKGVILDHRGAMNRMEWLRRRYALQPGDRVVQKTPLIFDLAIWEIFGPLMAGATLLMADARAESDIAHVSALLDSPRTVFAYFVPSMLESYLNFAARRPYADLRWAPATGEAVPTALLEKFSRHFPLEFHNIYGNTETSELALWEGSQWTETAMVPIGRAIGIYRLYILDAALNPVPPHVPGEICIAGIGGLARGYQGLPGLTAEKFVPNPYAVVPGERLYRSGDLGRIDADGLMEHVGRIDQQVKIRGCRIETAEIESVLSRHEAVHTCAVVARNDTSGSAQLLAYVVGEGIAPSALGAHVEKFLPRYMLPAAYIFVQDLPLTPSGKLDRSKLPAPRTSDFEARAAHEPPQSELERELATVWTHVLGLQNVGRGDSFFSLGGNSLKSIQVIARVKDEFGVDVRVRDFFSNPTVAGLAGVVERLLVAYVASLSDEEVKQHMGHVA